MRRKTLTPVQRLTLRLSLAFMPSNVLAVSEHANVSYRQALYTGGDIPPMVLDDGLDAGIRHAIACWHRDQPQGSLDQLLRDLGISLQNALDIAVRVMGSEPSYTLIVGIFNDLVEGVANMSLTDAERRAVENRSVETLVQAGSLFDRADRILRGRRQRRAA